jgi:hypothetical protein
VTLTSELRAAGNLAGSVRRPTGADQYGPKAGTVVAWVVSQPIADLLAQGKRLGWANMGTIGNAAHLRLHGDHTPWSLGKAPGVLYAKDTALPAGGSRALLALCRLADYDTSWIQFFNVDGRQYDYAGRDIGSSGDYHLHVSVKAGAESKRVTLFDDMASYIAGTFRKPARPAIFTRLGFIDGATLSMDPTVWLVGRGKKARVANTAELAAIQDYMRSRNMATTIRTATVIEGTEV